MTTVRGLEVEIGAATAGAVNGAMLAKAITATKPMTVHLFRRWRSHAAPDPQLAIIGAERYLCLLRKS
jgi:hypothetical protein